MPYSFEELHIPREYDRRVKVTDDDRLIIKRMFNEGVAIRAITRHFEGRLSRKIITYVIYPERQEKARADYKERRKDGRYYNRDRHREAMRRHRAHKRELNKAGKLLEPITL